jgi:hypothetical protein
MVFLFFMGTIAVAAQDVRYDFDKDTTFSRFQTYKWVPIKGADEPDALTAKQLIAAVDTELSKKGLSKTDADSADLSVAYQTAIGSEKQHTSYSTGWDYGPGWGRAWYGYGGMSTGTTYGSTSTVLIGQLDLSIYDSADKQLIWRGVVSKSLDPTAKPDKKQRTSTKPSRNF